MFEVGLSTTGKNIGNEKCGLKLFEIYREGGIKHMEISLGSEEYDTFDFKGARKAADENGVNLWTFHLPFKPFKELDISSSDASMRKKSVAYTAELIRKAGNIGIDKYVVHSGGITKRLSEAEVSERIECAKESYAALAEVAEKAGGTVCVENLPPVCVGCNIAEVEELISADSRLRVCLDTNHLLPGDPAEFARYFGDKIITVHISDYDLVNERHWLPGEGKLDWQSVYSALCEIGYKGPWLYEIAFVSLPTLTRERDLTCADFIRNAHEIFENKEITRIPGVVNVEY